MGFKIKQYAREQGKSLGEVSRKLGMPLSNLSAVASGRRSVSLRLLARIAAELECSIPELFEAQEIRGVFKSPELNARIVKIEQENYLGRDKGWTHRLMLAQRNHYPRIQLKS